MSTVAGGHRARHAAGRANPPPGVSAGFRPDVEGLRAVAILTVMWFHARLPGLPGGFAGVDIFFVISGFLITGQLVREVERTGRVSLLRFYARRAKRLFPAAATVLLITSVLTVAFLNLIDRGAFGGDITAAAAYVVNWRLAARSVNYLAEDVGASPVQHFWSLAVEEQFYLVWPLLILALTVLIRRGHLRVRPGLALGLAAITLPSLGWSIYLTASDPDRAYFVTTTRLWELGIGALVAVGSLVWSGFTGRTAALVAWGGVALLGVGLVAQSTATPWPGSAALVPTLGAAMVLTGGLRAGPDGPVRFLGQRLPVAIGALSYSLYLWHWPFVVVSDALTDSSRVWAAIAIVLSAGPAYLTHRFIENPVRFHPLVANSAQVALLVGLACSLLGVIAGTLTSATSPAGRFASSGPGSATGAGALPTSGTTSGAGSGKPTATPLTEQPRWMTPEPAKATLDVPISDTDDCTSPVTSDVYVVCDYGAKTSATIVAAVGDSKLSQWLPALDKIGVEHNWRIRLYSKSGCTWTAATLDLEGQPNLRCHTWGEKVMQALDAQPPELVIVSGLRARAYAADGTLAEDALVDGYVDYWSRLADRKIAVVAIEDTAGQTPPEYECVLENPDDFMTTCAFPAKTGSGTAALTAATKRVPTSTILPVTDLLCPGGRCVPVIGNVLVRRQGSHLTATYVESLTSQLDSRLRSALAKLKVTLPTG